MKPITIHPLSAIAGGVLVGTALLLAGMGKGTKTYDMHLSREAARILSRMSIEFLDDGQGGMVETIRVSGVNFQIVNGLGGTNTLNAAGNLIVGYNEFGNPDGDDRTGSHNLFIGTANSASNYGGLVVGEQNTVAGFYASVTGGQGNIASGYASVVAGGLQNMAISVDSVVSGGRGNTAAGHTSSISGGFGNTVMNGSASISGGVMNQALGLFSSVSGGQDRIAPDDFNWAAGDLLEVD